MKNKLYEGQKLRTSSNEIVTIIQIVDGQICFKYHGKYCWQNIDVVGRSLLPVIDDGNETSPEQPHGGAVVSEEPIDSCKNCVQMRRQECIGDTKICEFYQHAVIVPQEEIDNWPKYGDATYFRMTSWKK